MKIYTLDFETYYDPQYSLSKMGTFPYIMDPRFEPILLSVREGDKPAFWVPQSQIEECLRDLQLHLHAARAHNMRFDGGILSFRYGIIPKLYLCTLEQARSLGLAMPAGGLSLERILNLFRAAGYDVPEKGTEVQNAVRKRFTDFTPTQLQAYGEYGLTDVDGSAIIGDLMLTMLPDRELLWQDSVMRMYTQPKLRLDRDILERDLLRVQLAKEDALKEVMEIINGLGGRQVTSLEEVQGELRSNEKMANLFRSVGGTLEDEEPRGKFIIPQKVSPTTGKTTWAFAKSDVGMVELTEHPDPVVATLAEVRMNAKSSIQETRLASMINLSQWNVFPLPYLVSGAHTHRLSGTDGINVQNMPSGRVAGQSTAMRDSIQAPDGKLILVSDSAQIEPRMAAFEANERGLVEVFATGQDPYSYMASHIFGGDPVEISKRAKAGEQPYSNLQRPLGKESVLGLGYGMGRVKFRDNVFTNTGIDLSEDEATRIVDIYRSTNSNIVGMWREIEQVLHRMISGASGTFGGPNGDLFFYDGSRMVLGKRMPGIMLPDGMWLNYYGLAFEDEPETPEDYLARKLGKVYNTRKKFTFYRREGYKVEKGSTYGAKVFENLTQALAFSLIKYQGLMIRERFPFSGNSHDEYFMVIGEDEVDEATQWVNHCMSQVPPYLEGLVVKCEIGVHKQYGKA